MPFGNSPIQALVSVPGHLMSDNYIAPEPVERRFNLLDEYDFSEEKLQDTIGIKPPKMTS
jgi:hypothetical protein